jgi:hypothetical protein
MLDGTKPLRALSLLASLAFAGVLGAAVASCSSNGTRTNGYGGNGTPATLVSECDQICGNVVSMCAPATAALGTCLSACGDLNLLPQSCLNPFLSYVTCEADVTQVDCNADGTYVLVSPSQCEDARQETLDCNASPGLISACVALPGNASCGTPDLAGTNPVFCVGVPNGCSAPAPNPLGIGVYCCP